ncbi:MAG: YgjP-like metallopeptidase domain-containing protein [Muribaculaceae bacterium]
MGIYSLVDKQFGEMIVCTRKGMSSMTVRWDNGRLRICIPEGVSEKWIFNTLEPMRNRILLLNHHAISYGIGQEIVCYRHKVKIGTYDGGSRGIGYGGDGSDLYVNISKDADITDSNIIETISLCICRLMARRAEGVLIPHAIEVAKSLGVMPRKFVIGRGFHKLGHCTTQKDIQLSHNLMFLPEELIDFVICHELAHLTHMNHSMAFHDLCNKYCNGREATLKRALKNFHWCIIR